MARSTTVINNRKIEGQMETETTTTTKADAKARTSITMQPQLLEKVRALAASREVSVSYVIEEAVSKQLGVA